MWVAKVMLPQPISKFLLKNLLVTTRNNGKGHIGDSVVFGATNRWQFVAGSPSSAFSKSQIET